MAQSQMDDPQQAALRERLTRATREYRNALKEAFENPKVAEERHRNVFFHNPERATRLLKERPELFGDPKPTPTVEAHLDRQTALNTAADRGKAAYIAAYEAQHGRPFSPETLAQPGQPESVTHEQPPYADSRQTVLDATTPPAQPQDPLVADAIAKVEAFARTQELAGEIQRQQAALLDAKSMWMKLNIQEHGPHVAHQMEMNPARDPYLGTGTSEPSLPTHSSPVPETSTVATGRAFQREIAKIYVNPDHAMKSIKRAMGKDLRVAEAVLKDLRETPEKFGKLQRERRSGLRGRLGATKTDTAREHGKVAAQRGHTMLVAQKSAAEPVKWRDPLTDHVHEGRAAVRAAVEHRMYETGLKIHDYRATMQALGGLAYTRQQAAVAMQGLTPDQQVQVEKHLTKRGLGKGIDRRQLDLMGKLSRAQQAMGIVRSAVDGPGGM